MKHKALALVLALCMLLAVLPGVHASAAMNRLPQPLAAPAALPQSIAQPMSGAYTITMRYTGNGVAELYATSAGPLQRVYFLADPNPGYRVSFDKCGYYMDQHSLELRYIGGNLYEITMPDGNVILDLEFVPIETESHDVTLTVTEGGTVSVDQSAAKAGESLFVEAAAAPGYSLDSVKARSDDGWTEGYYLGKDGGVEHYEVFMPDDELEILVTFTRNGPFAITAWVDSDPAGGTVSLSHTEAYEQDTVTVTAHPDPGYQVADINCSRSQLTKTGENQWSFSMPKYREEVHVTFEAVVYPVSVTVQTGLGGTASVDLAGATVGQTVTLTCVPQEGYRVAQVTGADLTDQGDGVYSFSMPAGAVELQVLFLRENNPFLDVTEKRFYYDSVIWAVENGITKGIDDTHFIPDQVCSRAQAVTFLWRACGSPEPVSAENPFTDVIKGRFYYKAVLWAVENGITKGTGAATFAPDDMCTRGQVVTFLWRAAGSPEPETAERPFTDVKPNSYCDKAVLWAVENSVTNGMAADSFAPDDTCTRGQVVTFLYRAAQIPEPEPEPFPDLS